MSIFDSNYLLIFLTIGIGLSLGFAKLFIESGAKKLNWFFYSLIPFVLSIIAYAMLTISPVDTDSFGVFVLVGITLFAVAFYELRLTVLPKATNLELACLLTSVMIAVIINFELSISLGIAICIALIFLILLFRNKLDPLLGYYAFLALNIAAVALIVYTATSELGNIINQPTFLTPSQITTIFLICLTLPIHFIWLVFLIRIFRTKYEDPQDHQKRRVEENEFIKQEKILENQITPRDLWFIVCLAASQIFVIFVLKVNPIFSLAYSLTIIDFVLNLSFVKQFFGIQSSSPARN